MPVERQGGPPGGILDAYRQTQAVALALDSSQVDGGAAATLLTKNITSRGGRLLIDFSIAATSDNDPATATYSLLLDGAVIARGVNRYNGSTDTLAELSGISFFADVAIGQHTVAVQWAYSSGGGGSLRCAPVATPGQFATLIISEVDQ